MEQAEYDTGNPEEDLKAQSLIRQLLYNPKLQAACPVPFDEAKLWKGQSGPELKQQIQKQFRNIRFQLNCSQFNFVNSEKKGLKDVMLLIHAGTPFGLYFELTASVHLYFSLCIQMYANPIFFKHIETYDSNLHMLLLW